MISSFALKDRYGIMGGLVQARVDEILPSARFAFLAYATAIYVYL